MTTPTSPWNIPLFAPGDTIPSLEGVLNSISTGLNTALNTMNPQTFTRSTTLALLPSTGNVIGQHATVYSDTTKSKNIDYYWNGTAWVPAGGLIPIIPSLATPTGGSVTVDGSGHIDFTAVTALQLDGIFTSAFDNYMILINQDSTSAATSLVAQLCAGGVASTSSNYVSGNFGASSSSANPQWSITNLTAARTDAKLEFYGPARAEFTLGEITTMSSGAANNVAASELVLHHGLASAFDGFKFAVSGGNATGRMRVFGYAR